MSPEELRDLLPLYALGALTPEERARVEEALKAHPELWEEAKAFLETAADLAQALPPLPPPPGLEERVMARIRPRRPFLPLLARAAAFLLLLFLGYGLYQGGVWVKALGEANSRVVTLVSPEGRVVGRALIRSDRRVLLVLNTPPPPGRVYQAWGLGQGAPRPLPVFRWPVTTFRLPEEAQAVAVSLEPPGGSPAPTQVLGLPQGL